MEGALRKLLKMMLLQSAKIHQLPIATEQTMA